ncbi:hypothetical protein [Bradyrhizobium sp. OAE829]|uniref:hypothetical protein n=1 Tax=Bradyrhizobium sp. OAE829 TaxID=2663807 RepID=UPI001789D71A
MPMLVASRDKSAQIKTNYSGIFTVKNLTEKPVTGASLAMLDYDRHPLWSDPAPFSKSISPGKSASVNLTPKKLRIVEFKIKFFIDGIRHLVEVGHAPGSSVGKWYFYTTIELTIDPWGYFLSKQAWEEVGPT